MVPLPATLLPAIEAIYERDRLLIAQSGEETCAPDGGCPGWAPFNDGTEIQRCDDCARFASDEDAVDHVAKRFAEIAALLLATWGSGSAHDVVPLLNYVKEKRL